MFIKKYKPFIIPILFLILIDQTAKIIISKVFMQYEFDILGEILRFAPVLNIRLSYLGNFIDILSAPAIAVLINIFALYIFLSGYSLYKAKKTNTGFWVKVIMISGTAGCLCSLTDKLFWGGSLDFLQIPNFFTFDLKDCYITIAWALFVVIGILHNKEISVEEYFRFCCNKFRL